MSLRICDAADQCAVVMAVRELLLRRLRGFDLRGLSDAELDGLAAGDADTVQRVNDAQRTRTPAEARAIVRELFGDVGPTGNE